jgi:hypothetical protein
LYAFFARLVAFAFAFDFGAFSLNPSDAFAFDFDFGAFSLAAAHFAWSYFSSRPFSSMCFSYLAAAAGESG